MTTNGSIKHLLAQLAERTERAEMQAASAERRAVLAEERTARLETVLSADGSPGTGGIRRRLPREPRRDRGQGNGSRLSRATFLGRAGALVAGAAGAALLEGHGTKDAYASTDTNFVATGIAGGGGSGFQTNALNPFFAGFSGSGTAYGAFCNAGSTSGTGSGGIGVYGRGGDTSAAGSAGAGVSGIGGGNSGTGTGAAAPGVLASGGAASGVPGGAGVQATGGNQSSSSSPAGHGVVATGGSNFAGGSQGGHGVLATGGTNGDGVHAIGSGSGVGVYGTNANGNGVWGNSSTATGVYGSSTYGWGVVANSSQSAGLNAFSTVGVGGVFGGGRAPINLAPATTLGPPTSGTHGKGDVWVDTNAAVWICAVAGTPGTFVPLLQGGLGNALFTAVSTQQYTLTNSDGVSWADMDSTSTTPLLLTITPAFNCQAILSGNADLWTSVAAFNQDIAIVISGGAYGTGQVVAWKESGGFAGTFSPNAAFVQTVQPLAAGSAYTIKLQWKANRAGSSTIWAGAGPIPAGSSTFSPTRLTASLVVSQ